MVDGDVLPQQLIDIADDALVSDDVDSDDSDEDYLYQLAIQRTEQ